MLRVVKPRPALSSTLCKSPPEVVCVPCRAGEKEHMFAAGSDGAVDENAAWSGNFGACSTARGRAVEQMCADVSTGTAKPVEKAGYSEGASAGSSAASTASAATVSASAASASSASTAASSASTACSASTCSASASASAAAAASASAASSAASSSSGGSSWPSGATATFSCAVTSVKRSIGTV